MVSESSKWRFQRPDGTWVRWNVDTQTWEHEAGPEEAEEPSSIDTEELSEAAESEQTSFSSTPEVIGWEEPPKRSVLPAILIGAIIGIAAGIALLLYFR